MNYISKSKPDILKNLTCPYCGITLTKDNISKEHVIGRKFVPKKALENSWNLILNACISCNNRKSDLEDDISSITQLNAAVYRKDFHDLKSLAEKAMRSISRRTRKSVIESIETMEIPINFGPNVKMTFSMQASPQIDNERANQLAFMQLKALYYLQSYDYEKGTGFFIPGKFIIIKNAFRSDWGNSINAQFSKIIETWEVRLNCISAKGNFECSTRKSTGLECWAWAIEWNEFYRIIGVFGREDDVKSVIDQINIVENKHILQSGDRVIYTHAEIPLNEARDILFSFPE